MKAPRIQQPLKIGLFGGTFNPIHKGHTQAATDVLAQFDLDQLYFIPSALPPHKARWGLATARDRCEMVRLAIDNHPKLRVSDVELQRAGPSYTIDTLKQFRARLPLGGQLYFILGLDAFLEINTWKDFRLLLEEAAFIVMSRPRSGSSSETFEQMVELFAREHVSADYFSAPHQCAMHHPHFQTIHLARVMPVDIASSSIREMIGASGDVSYWIDPIVENYIRKKGLYR